MLGLEAQGPGVPRSLPDRRRQDAGASFRPSAGSGSTRRFIPTSRCCCTGRPTTSGASTSSSAGTPIPKPRGGPSGSSRASRRCWGPTIPSSWNGSASTPSAASAWSGFATGACSSSATPRTRSRRSARAAPTAASRTPTTWPGSWRWCSRAWRARRAAGQLRCRAHPGGRREHPQLDPQHGLHHAEERGQPHVPRRDAAAGREVPVRAQAGEQRAPVAAARLPPLAARHARPRQLSRAA